ncbi:MAG: protein translocase subunit SecD, partial [Patescibacteria group bacterium]|nr:protein translocase subunit SecD [Patescibacteria group bacterium]
LRDVIERRVNSFGVSEPQVYTAQSGNSHQLIVELAGIKDINEAINQIGQTPLLDFRLVQQNGTSSVNFVPTGITGRYLTSAQLTFDQTTQAPQVSFNLNDAGAKAFDNLTKDNIGKPLCVFVDNNFIIPNDEINSCPKISGEIPSGQALINGDFTVALAKDLVARFNAGALPAPITLISQQTISPSLGSDSLKKAIFAGIIGTLLVMAFMIIYYRLLGVFAVMALIFYIIFTLSIFKLIPVTMSLSGLAGFILTIGMAVDANILIFERTKEELKKGLSRHAAIEEGFKRAWPSIRDSNVSTIITAIILYFFTSSFVRGFALTLLIGVITSMFSAITVTETFLRVFLKDVVKTKSQDSKVK